MFVGFSDLWQKNGGQKNGDDAWDYPLITSRSVHPISLEWVIYDGKNGTTETWGS
jgi:hypothetical protein